MWINYVWAVGKNVWYGILDWIAQLSKQLMSHLIAAGIVHTWKSRLSVQIISGYEHQYFLNGADDNMIQSETDMKTVL